VGEVLDETQRFDRMVNYFLQKYSIYCHQLVNQITGDIWDIKQAKEKFVKKSNQFFGVDLTAAIGHVVFPNDLEDYCDALWFSGHKFYTEKNIGAMWISDRLGEYLGVSKDPKNQHNLVHGTVDVAGACMIANALDWCTWCTKDKQLLNPKRWYEMYSFLNNKLVEQNIDSALVYSNMFDKSYAINAIYLRGINADALQTYLASKDIYIGVAHSACAGTEDYRVLEVMGFNKKIASQTIRVSFGADNNYDDVEGLVNEIKKFKELF
jgi:cysteine sulfinate desulfinase/cysteine desulfurase-like protein